MYLCIIVGIAIGSNIRNNYVEEYRQKEVGRVYNSSFTIQICSEILFTFFFPKLHLNRIL